MSASKGSSRYAEGCHTFASRFDELSQPNAKDVRRCGGSILTHTIALMTVGGRRGMHTQDILQIRGVSSLQGTVESGEVESRGVHELALVLLGI